MPTSGTVEAGLRLLGAFHDLSGGKLTEPVLTSDAVAMAGIDAQSVERDVAVRYLLNKGYLRAADAEDAYTLTVPGKDRVKEARGLGGSAPKEGRRMSDKTQRRLLTVFALATAMILTRPINKRIEEMVPERRGIKDDVLEAALQGLVRAVSVLAASVLVRKLAESRR
jgi:hypothetical protein